MIPSGSSPRGRGKHSNHFLGTPKKWLIPARAGKTCVCVRRSLSRRAHPRVGGENLTPAGRLVIDGGSSPRGRGKRDRDIRRRLQDRLIPAWAGKTRYRVRPRHRLGAHPRVGGENLARAVSVVRPGGSSPRGRGKQINIIVCINSTRLIPAWAGKTRTPTMAVNAAVAHPRVGGENFVEPGLPASGAGSSPRGRGKRRAVPVYPRAARLIPAWAGKTPSHARSLAYV